jgi:peptide/nickel transport system substrate-binding protein
MKAWRLLFCALLALILLAGLVPAPAAAQSQMSWAVHVSLAPVWFDPGEHTGIITLMMVLYALHDAMLKPMPGNPMAPSLAESWTAAKDGLTYEFVLRKGVVFHNGDPFTAEDVKFSFERYRGAASKLLKDKVAAVEIVDPFRVRFRLKEPWPDFMTFYGTTATAVGIVMPKKYYTQVGDDGFKKHPIGAGPYKFVSTNPGIEVVLEAFTGYWRRVPAVKTLVMRSVPEATTRALMLKTGEADIAYALDGPDAEDIKNTPGLQVIPSKHASIFWVEFPDQWDPKSPWHDQRVRLAANYALDRQMTNEAACLGFCPPAGVIVPRVMDFALQAPALPQDVAKVKQLLTEAGYPNGFDAGEFTPNPGFPTVADAIMNDLNKAGIRVHMRQMERATFYANWAEKKMHGLLMIGAGNSGNAASRVESFIYSKGAYAFGGYPDIDELFLKQASERDPKKREAILLQIQQLTIDRSMFAPVMDLRALMGIGPRVTKHTITDVWMSPFPSYEDMEIKG